MKDNYSPIEKLTIVLEGLKTKNKIAAVCGRYGIAEEAYYQWKELFLSGALSGLSGKPYKKEV